MFTYENFSLRSAPVNPKIVRIRSDITWEDILYNEAMQMQALSTLALNGITSCLVLFRELLVTFFME
jgi:hypothetical protein